MSNIVLMPHQEEGADWIASTDGDNLVDGDTGVGKSYLGIAAADRTGAKNILVICPAVARINWGREVAVCQTMDRNITVIEKQKDIQDDLEGFVIVSYDLAVRLAEQLSRFDWDFLFLDEVQFLKNKDAKRTRAVFGYRNVPGIAASAERILALSATPAPNHIGELWPWLHAIGYVTEDHSRFLRRHCRLQEPPWGIKVTGNKREAVAALMQRVSPSIMRIRKADVLKDLPPVRFSSLEVPGDRTAEHVRSLEGDYREEINQLIQSIQSKALPPSDHLTTLRRLTEMAKVGDCIALLSQELSDRAIKKVVVFATYRDTIKALGEGLSRFGVEILHGGIPAGRRQEAIDNFQSGDARVFVGQTVAASTAITLHANGACQDVVFVSADWVPSNNTQAVGRVHRKGQPGAVMARFLHLSNSIDEAVTRALSHKARMLGEIFGDRGDHHAA